MSLFLAEPLSFFKFKIKNKKSIFQTISDIGCFIFIQTVSLWRFLLRICASVFYIYELRVNLQLFCGSQIRCKNQYNVGVHLLPNKTKHNLGSFGIVPNQGQSKPIAIIRLAKIIIISISGTRYQVRACLCIGVRTPVSMSKT